MFKRGALPEASHITIALHHKAMMTISELLTLRSAVKTSAGVHSFGSIAFHKAYSRCGNLCFANDLYCASISLFCIII